MRRVIGHILAILIACGIAGSVLAQESQLDVLIKRDTPIVGTYSTSPLLAYFEDKGELVGFEIDLMRQMAKDLLGDEKKLEFVVPRPDGRFPAALSGKIDFRLCSRTVTPDRAVRIDFSYPIMDTGSTALARKDATVTKIQELNDPKFAYAILNVPPAIARAKIAMPNVMQLLLDSPSALFLAVKTGQAHAVAIDRPIADFHASENDDLTRVDTTGTALALVSNNAFFMKFGDFKWCLFLDTYARELRYGNPLRPSHDALSQVAEEGPAAAALRRREQPLGERDIAAAREKIGIVFQSYNLFPHITVLKNITAEPIRVKGVPRAKAEARARDLLALVGLSEKESAYPVNLSGGQQQRVAIARALAMDPKIMLFDEVTSALDPELMGEVQSAMRQLARDGMTMIVVTHEMSFARDVADRIVFMDGGVIVEEGAPDQLFFAPRTDRVRQSLQRYNDRYRI